MLVVPKGEMLGFVARLGSKEENQEIAGLFPNNRTEIYRCEGCSGAISVQDYLRNYEECNAETWQVLRAIEYTETDT